MLREMATTHGRSVFGYLWALAEPIGGIMLLTIVFSLAFRSPPMGTNFALYYASGFLVFVAYQDVSAKIAACIRFNKALLFYPAVTYVDAIIARLLLNILTQAMIGIIVLSAIITFFDVNVILDYRMMILGYGMAAYLALAIGTLNCFLGWAWPSWERIWSILMRPMFIISCVIFNYEDVPQPFQDYLWYNPLVHVVGTMRDGVYSTYRADYVSPLFVFGVGTIILLVGLLMLSRYQRRILND